MAHVRGRGRGLRRPTEWLGAIGAVTTDTSSTNSFFTLLSSAQLAEYVTPTIVRIRGTFWAQMTGTQVSGDFIPSICFGVTVVSFQADAAAAIPICFVDLDANWMLWDVIAPEGNSPTKMKLERVMETKAMRRIEQPDNSVLALSVSTTFAGGAGETNFRFAVRILVKGD